MLIITILSTTGTIFLRVLDDPIRSMMRLRDLFDLRVVQSLCAKRANCWTNRVRLPDEEKNVQHTTFFP